MGLQVAGVEVNPAIVAPLDPEFLPAALFNRKYRETVFAIGGVPLHLALEGGDARFPRMRLQLSLRQKAIFRLLSCTSNAS